MTNSCTLSEGKKTETSLPVETGIVLTNTVPVPSSQAETLSTSTRTNIGTSTPQIEETQTIFLTPDPFTRTANNPAPTTILSTLPPDIPITSINNQYSASELQATTYCEEGDLRRGVAELSWNVATSPGEEQRVQLTIVPNGFEQGYYQVSESLVPETTTYIWSPLNGQAIHTWRILTLHNNEWFPSDIHQFMGPLCIADIVTVDP